MLAVIQGRPLSALELPEAERAWLAGLGPIRFSYDPEFAPFEAPGPDGDYTGAAADMLALVAGKLGVRFELVRHPSWPESVQAIREGRIDLLPCIGRDAERMAYLLFTDPYLQFARVVVARRDFDYAGPAALADMRVAVQRDSSHHGFLRTATTLKPMLYDSFKATLLAVAAGEADVAIGNLATVTHMIQNVSLANLKIVGRLGDDVFSLHMGVRQGMERLVPLLNQALADIPPRQRYQILDHWVPLPQEADPALDLTRPEREWLLTHPRIRLGWDPAWAPVEFAAGDSSPCGYSVDLMNKIDARLGIRFVYEPPRPWPETLRLLEERRIDMVSCVGHAAERDAFLTVTDPYMSAPVVLFARKNFPYILNLNELDGLPVAVPTGYTESLWMTRDYPGIRQVPVATVKEGLAAVEKGKAVAFAGSVIQGNYYLAKRRNWTLNIAGETGYENDLRAGVRSDWPIFTGILNKAMKAVPESEKTAFYRKWVWLEYRHLPDLGYILRVAATAAICVLIILLWNRRLAREIRLRRESERQARESRTELERSYGALKAMERQKEHVTHMIVHDIRTPLTVLTMAMEEMAMTLRRGGSDHETFQTDIEMAQAGLGEIARMVDALLDVGRLEAGKMPVNRQPGKLRETAMRAVEGVTLLARQHEIQLAVDGVAGEGCFDAEVIRRVFVNLIANAIKACPPGARITVSIGAPDGRLRAEVRDTGKGIDPKYHDRIFEKFEQAVEPGTPSPRHSYGIGLAFCKLAVQVHEGTIGLESQLGAGSTFWFEFPSTLPPSEPS